MILWHGAVIVERGRTHPAGSWSAIEIGPRDGLIAILVVEEERHRRPGTEAVGERDGLAQVDDPGDPAIVEQVGDAKVGDFVDDFAIGGFGVDVLVVAKLGVNPEIGAAADGGRESLRAPRNNLPSPIQDERIAPVILAAGDAGSLNRRARGRGVASGRGQGRECRHGGGTGLLQEAATGIFHGREGWGEVPAGFGIRTMPSRPRRLSVMACMPLAAADTSVIAPMTRVNPAAAAGAPRSGHRAGARWAGAQRGSRGSPTSWSTRRTFPKGRADATGADRAHGTDQFSQIRSRVVIIRSRMSWPTCNSACSRMR